MLSGTDVAFGRTLALVWLTPAFITVIGLVATQGASAGRRRGWRRLANLAVLGYAVGVVAITLYPFTFDIETGRIFERGNWLPFGGTLGFLTSENDLQVEIGARDFLANIALFAPVGVLCGALTRRPREVGVCLIALVAMAFALEIVQGLTVAERTLDIDDAISGSLGAVGGVLAGRLVPTGRRARRSREVPGWEQ